MAISLDELYYKNLYVNPAQTQSIRTQNQNNQTQANKTGQANQATQNTQQSVNSSNEANTGVRLTLSQEAQQLRDRMRAFEASGNQNNYQDNSATTQNTGNLQSNTTTEVAYTPPATGTNTVPELPVNQVQPQPQNQNENQSSRENSQQQNSTNVQTANQNQIQQYQYALAGSANSQSGFVMDLFR